MDLISSLLDPRLVNPGSTLIHIGAYGPKFFENVIQIQDLISVAP